MFVGVDQLSWSDLSAEDFDFAAPTDRPGMSMSYAEPTSKSFESSVGHLVDVTNAAIGDRADTAKRAVAVAIHLSPVRAVGGGFVEILKHQDFGARH